MSAFERGFDEGDKGVYKFQDTSEGTLARFVEWSYTGDYPDIITGTHPPDRKSILDFCHCAVGWRMY
jgi:hypothetical protein